MSTPAAARGLPAFTTTTCQANAAAVRDALANTRALMAPAPDGTPSPRADNADAGALLAGAGALIDPLPPGPSDTARPK